MIRRQSFDLLYETSRVRMSTAEAGGLAYLYWANDVQRPLSGPQRSVPHRHLGNYHCPVNCSPKRSFTTPRANTVRPSSPQRRLLRLR
jgi:hypothetical protein